MADDRQQQLDDALERERKMATALAQLFGRRFAGDPATGVAAINANTVIVSELIRLAETYSKIMRLGAGLSTANLAVKAEVVNDADGARARLEAELDRIAEARRAELSPEAIDLQIAELQRRKAEPQKALPSAEPEPEPSLQLPPQLRIAEPRSPQAGGVVVQVGNRRYGET